MTDEQMRIAIAEAMGLFRIEPLRRTTRKRNDDPNGVRVWYCSEHHGGAATYSEVPNYLEDLNACASFEATLTDEEHNRYRAHIYGMSFNPRECFSAKPKQRCIAFLKVKGILP